MSAEKLPYVQGRGRGPMRPLRAFVTALLAVVIFHPVGQAAAAPDSWTSGDPIRAWTGLALDAVASSGAGDAGAARTYAMVDAAMYDAVNALLPPARRHRPAIVAPRREAAGDPAVAAAAAAHDVLVALYPQYSAQYDDLLASAIDSSGSPDAASRGATWGEEVAAGVLRARAEDGLVGTETQAASTIAGEFDQPWNAQPRHLAPFVIDHPRKYVDAGPPALDSAEYAAAFNIVEELGDSSRADPDADAIFRFWSLGTGTEQPPGAWLRVAATVSAERSLSLDSTARLFALTSMAMADTVAPTYETKTRYHFWRPVAAIARATEDGNPDTMPADHAWTPRGGKSGSPEHWSGHSSFSAAAATVLAAYFGDDVPFTLVTGSSQGVSRPFTSFSQAAAEAGGSRVLGGLHFPFSNAAGLVAGRQIATEVLKRARLAPAAGAPADRAELSGSRSRAPGRPR